ncbi:unnamed protein product [Rotaria sordida]|uniref:DNA primase small subunit n=1 Tax=Rotaria sordida TaxID=392033 RepID=A0A819R981_9BILA|nr:unnamed protein product [Rotaria sordida]CAF3917545.1 unnamed protein product [Rotaria sordida]CAF4010834.1 unnamed protein product [Rotaria sordida]CAF4043768.1 unnamed protein product [Rotaria sordida]
MFEYCYPRLDANVTKGMNHLLKSPFTVHPKTDRISIPINLNSLRYFDPYYNQTSLTPFVDVFARFVQGLQTSKQDKVLAKSGQLFLLLYVVHHDLFILDLNTMLSGEI